MPTRITPGNRLPYYLVCFDKEGVERREEDGTLPSERVIAAASSIDPKVTDVFVLSHGWKGDVPAAIEQYDRWIDAMADCTQDRTRARTLRPGFTPLVVGFHWPSLPFGDDDTGGSAFDTSAGVSEDAFVDIWADRIADTPTARHALRTLYAAALEDLEPDKLSPAVVTAYGMLDREAGLGQGLPSAAPEADRAGFDPQQLYVNAMESDASFGGGIVGGLLSPLRQLSFWTMKKRARACGETGGHSLVAAIRAAGGPGLRIHLMGHSFGCIVIPAMLRCAAAAMPVTVSSVLLVQGALSLWTFAAALPRAPSSPGWFRPVIDRMCVAGPMVITTSRHDRAVGTLYPAAAGAAGQVAYDTAADQLPTYGALGTYGARGSGLSPKSLALVHGDVTGNHALQAGQIYNVNCDDVIRAGGGLSGAHSDIAHAELGHLFWNAVLAAP